MHLSLEYWSLECYVVDFGHSNFRAGNNDRVCKNEEIIAYVQVCFEFLKKNVKGDTVNFFFICIPCVVLSTLCLNLNEVVRCSFL
jgi:hypothetical protein